MLFLAGVQLPWLNIKPAKILFQYKQNIWNFRTSIKKIIFLRNFVNSWDFLSWFIHTKYSTRKPSTRLNKKDYHNTIIYIKCLSMSFRMDEIQVNGLYSNGYQPRNEPQTPSKKLCQLNQLIYQKLPMELIEVWNNHDHRITNFAYFNFIANKQLHIRMRTR